MDNSYSHRSLLIITYIWPECGRWPTLIHPNEWNLTVRRMGVQSITSFWICRIVSVVNLGEYSWLTWYKCLGWFKWGYDNFFQKKTLPVWLFCRILNIIRLNMISVSLKDRARSYTYDFQLTAYRFTSVSRDF